MKPGESWLDPQTKEILQPQPPERIAPPTLPQYSLVLLEAGGDRARMLRAVRRVNDCDDSEAADLLQRRFPLIVNTDLSHHDALLGQFELVCCDAIGVFISSEVVAMAEPYYLRDLYARLRHSPEFQEAIITVRSVPKTQEGLKFVDQFLGLSETDGVDQGFPVNLPVLQKKARIMAHWASRIGADVGFTRPRQ